MNDLLRSRGVPEKLLAQLVDMGRLGELIRGALEQASDSDLKTIIEKWKKATK